MYLKDARWSRITSKKIVGGNVFMWRKWTVGSVVCIVGHGHFCMAIGAKIFAYAAPYALGIEMQCLLCKYGMRLTMLNWWV